MKAVIEIDMPERCSECQFNKWSSWHYCAITGRDTDGYRTKFPPHCPLKPFSNHLIEEDMKKGGEQ